LPGGITPVQPIQQLLISVRTIHRPTLALVSRFQIMPIEDCRDAVFGSPFRR
jgi:hypothetical protein